MCFVSVCAWCLYVNESHYSILFWLGFFIIFYCMWYSSSYSVAYSIIRNSYPFWYSIESILFILSTYIKVLVNNYTVRQHQHPTYDTLSGVFVCKSFRLCYPPSSVISFSICIIFVVVIVVIGSFVSELDASRWSNSRSKWANSMKINWTNYYNIFWSCSTIPVNVNCSMPSMIVLMCLHYYYYSYDSCRMFNFI